jgi:hypothetical protein
VSHFHAILNGVVVGPKVVVVVVVVVVTPIHSS